MSTSRIAWRKTPLTREQWEANCHASSHRHTGEIINYNENQGVVSAFVRCSNGASVFIGAYFIKSNERDIIAGCGWNHE
jgi:hypothetical protein